MMTTCGIMWIPPYKNNQTKKFKVVTQASGLRACDDTDPFGDDESDVDQFAKRQCAGPWRRPKENQRFCKAPARKPASTKVHKEAHRQVTHVALYAVGGSRSMRRMCKLDCDVQIRLRIWMTSERKRRGRVTALPADMWMLKSAAPLWRKEAK